MKYLISAIFKAHLEKQTGLQLANLEYERDYDGSIQSNFVELNKLPMTVPCSA